MIKFTVDGDSWTMELISECMTTKDQDHLHQAVEVAETLVMDMDQVSTRHHHHHHLNKSDWMEVAVLEDHLDHL